MPFERQNRGPFSNLVGSVELLKYHASIATKPKVLFHVVNIFLTRLEQAPSPIEVHYDSGPPVKKRTWVRNSALVQTLALHHCRVLSGRKSKSHTDTKRVHNLVRTWLNISVLKQGTMHLYFLEFNLLVSRVCSSTHSGLFMQPSFPVVRGREDATEKCSLSCRLSYTIQSDTT